MTKLKQSYLSPETDLLVVRFEGAFLQASQFSDKGTELMPIDDEDDF